MKFLKIITLTTFLLAVLFIYKTGVLAASKTDGDLQVTYDSPLFESAIVWYPSLEEARNFRVKNLGSETHTVYVQPTNTSQTGSLASVFFTRFIHGEQEIYGESDSKTMNQFFSDGQINLSDLSSGQEKQYDMAIKFWQGAGNEYQGKQLKFDLIVGFEGEDEQVVIEVSDINDETTIPSPSPVVLFLGVSYFPEASPQPSVEQATLEDKPEVKGAVFNPWQPWWWFPLIIQLAATVIYYWLVRKKKIYLWWFLPMIISAISQLTHQLWRGNECVDTIWCQRYWLLNLAILLITFSYFKAKLFLKQTN